MIILVLKAHHITRDIAALKLHILQSSLSPQEYGKRTIDQSCLISIFPYRFNINYSVCFLINITINYFQEGLSISILYQLFKKFPYQFQYQYLLSISPYNIVKITNFLSISHSYQYQY